MAAAGATTAGQLRLEDLRKRFGPVDAVDGVELDVPEGRLVCFLGPSGCGKTTLLRLVAGLEEPDAGRILFGGRDITGMPAHRRGFGMVFQSLALFPHLDVAGNIAYGLVLRGVDRSQREQRVAQLLELVRMPGLGSRNIRQLSGGQRQRVALARALAIEPGLLLLDEPLSALDAKLREEMQVEIRLLQQRLGTTTILVTHDQREAMTMADLVVVMHAGRIQQVGAPLEVYRRPANTFVADFIGTSNLLSGRFENGAIMVADRPIRVAERPPWAEPGRPVTLCVRPEDVHLLPGHGDGPNRLPGRVAFIRDVGQSVEFHVDCGGLMVLAHLPPRDRPPVAVGDAVSVELPPESCVPLRS